MSPEFAAEQLAAIVLTDTLASTLVAEKLSDIEETIIRRNLGIHKNWMNGQPRKEIAEGFKISTSEVDSAVLICSFEKHLLVGLVESGL